VELLEGVTGGRLTAFETLAQAIGLTRHHVHHPIAGGGRSGLQLTHEMQLLVPEEALEASTEPSASVSRPRSSRCNLKIR
jgi:hypothetical protein